MHTETAVRFLQVMHNSKWCTVLHLQYMCTQHKYACTHNIKTVILIYSSPFLSGLRGARSSPHLGDRSDSRPASLFGLWPPTEASPGVRCKGMGHCSVRGRRHIYPGWCPSSSESHCALLKSSHDLYVRHHQFCVRIYIVLHTAFFVRRCVMFAAVSRWLRTSSHQRWEC